MTDANAQPRMATNAEAMTAAHQLLPATASQPMAASGAFRQDAWMRRGPRMRNDRADLVPESEWHRDQMRRSDHARRQAPAGIDFLAAQPPAWPWAGSKPSATRRSTMLKANRVTGLLGQKH